MSERKGHVRPLTQMSFALTIMTHVTIVTRILMDAPMGHTRRARGRSLAESMALCCGKDANDEGRPTGDMERERERERSDRSGGETSQCTECHHA